MTITNALSNTVLADQQANVYIYRYNDTPYLTIVAVAEKRHWLVMFGLDGVMESAYVVERPDRYLKNTFFELIGTLDEVLK